MLLCAGSCFSTLSAGCIDFAGALDAQHFQYSAVEPNTSPAAIRRRLSVCSRRVQMMGWKTQLILGAALSLLVFAA